MRQERREGTDARDEQSQRVLAKLTNACNELAAALKNHGFVTRSPSIRSRDIVREITSRALHQAESDNWSSA